MRHRKVIAYIALFTVSPIALFIALVAYSPETSLTSATPTQTDPSPVINLDGVAVFVNRERAKVGLRPLTRNSTLDKTAQIKCNDLVARDYWSHDAPDGTKYGDIMTREKFWYYVSGENLAYGFADAQSTVVGWMNSKGHKENIVRTTYTDVGYAQCEYPSTSKRGNQTVVVQHFADPV